MVSPCSIEIYNMSFSAQVKEEIAKQLSSARHCQLAELAVIISNCSCMKSLDGGEKALLLTLDREELFRKCFTLLHKTYNIEIVSENEQEILITQKDRLEDILMGIGMLTSDGFRGFGEAIDSRLLKNACCKRAFLKGAFLCLGSMSDPQKGYHLEMVCDTESMAKQLVEVLAAFDIEARIVLRKRYHVVYIKEGAAIVDFLNVCEAHVSLMDLENLRILKEVSNTVNRRVNCETANIAKTVKASGKQVEDILLIQRRYGFEKLPQGLKEIAEVRLEYPEATLKELGELLDPPMGKSGVNHRLRKLSEIAESLG